MRVRILNREGSGQAEDGWYQIEVTGTHATGQPDVDQVIDAEAIQSIVANFKELAAAPNFSGMLVDMDHLSHYLDKKTEAYAWLWEVAERDGELWGRLEWTDIGADAVRNKRVKFFSTEYDPHGIERINAGLVRPKILTGLALTNRPNNKGGRPIKNRVQGTLETIDLPGDAGPKKDNMKDIATQLGLPPEATEEQVLEKLKALQSELETLRKSVNEMEAEQILNRHAGRIPASQREAWKAQLILNRQGTEALLAGLPEPETKTAPQPIHNRATATPPKGATASEVPGQNHDELASKQAEAVAAIRNRDRSTFGQAWEVAKRERPELFPNLG